MGEFDFTYILPENFEKRVVQYLLQLANRQLAEAFQHCKYEYEDVGLAYYAGLREGITGIKELLTLHLKVQPRIFPY